MKKLRILLIGNGGREHALAWKLSQSPRVEAIYAVPGNGGTAACAKTTNVTSVAADDYPALAKFALSEAVDLVVPGPEAPLVDGIHGFFEARGVGIPCFGPSQAAARMEGSKTFSKDFMKRHGIPTADYANFASHDEAVAYIDSVSHNVVIKASGLAAGKGVIIPATKDEARAAVKQIMVDQAFGDAGREVVIEECLEGGELSILTFSDGSQFHSLPPAQDHKRIFDGDQGPNTGGMGCYAPTNIATRELVEKIDQEIIRPTIDGMRREGTKFVGVLFTGLMITKDGPKVLEYNVRFGDPETQTVLPLLSPETDLAEIMFACTQGILDSIKIDVQPRFSATVVIAAGGYPGSYAKGTPMTVHSAPADINVFHAGTQLDSAGQLKTSGGRVIAVNATAASLEAAVKRAYEGVEQLVQFEGMYYRRDIAHRALKQAPPPKKGLTYAAAGVSVDAGNAFVQRIKKAVASTAIPGADAVIGGFGGELDLAAAGVPSGSIAVGAIDGVGTKLVIAKEVNKHDTVGVDLVAMNVNDLVVQGARPLMFLDYVCCGRLDEAVLGAVVEGVARGCVEAGCALVGGETAEMPGMLQGDHYDAAGAAVGFVARDRMLPRKGDMTEGDVLLGLASSGVHSNGFTLVRRIVALAGLGYGDPAPWDAGATVGESLLTPTRIYVRSVLSVLEAGAVKGLAHITGGGLVDNVPRMLPAHLAAEIERSWPVPAVFGWLQAAGGVEDLEMYRTFNNGIGMVVAVGAADAKAVAKGLEAAGETVYRIGRLVARLGEGCVIK